MANFALDDYNYDEFNELVTELPDKLPFEEDD